MRYQLAVLFIALFTAPALLAQQATLKECQRYKDQAERYQELRRQGGSGPQMDEWKNRMRDYELKFRQGDCRRFRRELKD